MRGDMDNPVYSKLTSTRMTVQASLLQVTLGPQQDETRLLSCRMTCLRLSMSS